MEIMDQDSKKFDEIRKESYITPNLNIDKPPVAISIGSYNGEPIPFGTYGNFSCITGPSKVGKSFMKQALLAGYIGGRTTAYFPEIRGHGSGLIFDFDTEQSPWHVSRMVRNIMTLTREAEDEFTRHYFAHALREYDPIDRLNFIDWALTRTFENNRKVGVVAIDGIADLMRNVNDLEASNQLIGKLMKWTTVYQIHVIVVVHLNFGDNAKPTGHVGSAITKKAETVLRLMYKDQPSFNNPFGVVECTTQYSRNMRIAPFSFTLEGGLPISTETQFVL